VGVMPVAAKRLDEVKQRLDVLPANGLYLDRCQVDTPKVLVEQVWTLLQERREHFETVVDFGAGDGRFALHGSYDSYCGYEIDKTRYRASKLPANACIKNMCAFSESVSGASLCLGNPPYVRNQDLPAGWRELAARTIESRTGFRVPGLANAWQYFFMQSLASTSSEGIVALVIPFEWVSRPSSASLRDYIKARKWGVTTYRLDDSAFDRVLTTASITIVDKRRKDSKWEFFKQRPDGTFAKMRSPSGGRRRVLGYSAPSDEQTVRAKRGLSPGTQEYLTLTERERARCALKPGVDVVPCVTSLRHTSASSAVLDAKAFQRDFVSAGKKCWLIRTDKAPSKRLSDYVESVPVSGRQSATCSGRAIWWKFAMPSIPAILVASGFRGRPKAFLNVVGAMAVGGVCGVYGLKGNKARTLVDSLRAVDYSGRVVAHSHGLQKLEINQLNELITGILEQPL